jgi:hypothetical protein
MHSEQMSTAREPAELLHTYSRHLVGCSAQTKPSPHKIFLMLQVLGLYLVIRHHWLRKPRKSLSTLMADSKEIRAGNNPLVFRQTQPSFFQVRVWLHVSGMTTCFSLKRQLSGQYYKTFEIRYNTVQLLSKFFIHQLMHKWIVLKTILKFTLELALKQLRHVLVQSHHHQEAHYSCLLKWQLLKQSIKIYRCVVMWLAPHRCILNGYFNNFQFAIQKLKD